MRFEGLDYLIVGSGLFGSVVAERIANELGRKVVVVESRPHIGGNCHSYQDSSTGIEVHAYGTHIFHTKNQRVWDYLNRFVEFTGYQHRVLTQYRDRVYPMPISLATINAYYGSNLKPRDVADFILKESRGEGSSPNPSNLEEKAISLIGRPLYEAFIKGYTAKQWGCDPRELPAEIITRLPVRQNYNTCYFNDPYQGMPKDGYGELFKKLLNHPNIEVLVSTDFQLVKHQIPSTCQIIYTGPIDRFFDYKVGRLDWRSLRFEEEVHDVEDYQGTSVLNYADMDVPFTRIHEFKHLHPEREAVFKSQKTIIRKEFSLAMSRADQECYYPVNTKRNEDLFKQYQLEASKLKNITFGGRLGSYRYIDMDETVNNALTAFDLMKKELCAT